MGSEHRVGGVYAAAALLVPSSIICFIFSLPDKPTPLWAFTALGGGVGGVGLRTVTGGKNVGELWKLIETYSAMAHKLNGGGSFAHTSG